jgi:2-polyprenyl-6-hydroxyphenyl methylase/3-demethylubiquinone-9 3-methyltransferase
MTYGPSTTEPGGPVASRPNAAPQFVSSYESKSLSPATQARFRTVYDKIMTLARHQGRNDVSFDVLDIGCGAGTQCRLWAANGHRVTGIDVSEPLVALAARRAAEAGLQIRFDLGSATQLPYADATQDVCLLPQLLEHVPDWKSCLKEAVRVLRAGGMLYVSTSNLLCPRQHEFNLPLYSWYPPFLKRHYERLAMTTRPDLANHASFPAVHWFTYRRLADLLATLEMRCYDRFQLLDYSGLHGGQRAAAQLLQAIPVFKFPAQFFFGTSVVFAVKK